MTLNKIDLKILKNLDKDPKITTTKLGKLCLVSQQVADYRLKSLMEKRTILSFNTIINFFHTGHHPYLLLLKTDPLNAEQKKRIKDHILMSEKIHIARNTGGTYDYTLFLLVKNYSELDDELDSFFKKLTFVKDYEIYPVTEINYYKNKHLNNSNFDKITLSQPSFYEKLDELDIKILSEISDNCRKNNTEIGQKLDINYNTVKNRIDSMIERKIILGEITNIDCEHLDLEQYNLLISLRNYSKETEEKILSYCNTCKEISHSTHILGGIWNFKVGINTKNLESLQEIIQTIRSLFPAVDDISIIPIFDEIKRNNFPL